ncbi:hypothetical protein [Kitasatospora sp. GAS1066B]|uniref:hypothetical protein n=1 Tax=Kitasatospora sp. GAS1066B TaxID=3156271 RepID=UPI003518AC04
MEWQQAVERADRIAAHDDHPADTWDGRAVRGVVAVTLAGLASRQGCAVEDIEMGSVLWHLDQGPAVVYEFGTALGLAAEEAQPAEAGAEWAWLIRRWPAEPPLANSDGMPRGIGRGSQLPAVDVCTLWATAAARKALIAERPPGLVPHTLVRVVGGEHEGRSGQVVGPAWLMDDTRRTVEPGPPPGYEVVLTVPGQDTGPRWAVLPTVEGEIWMEAPGPHGDPVIVRASDLIPEEQ